MLSRITTAPPATTPTFLPALIRAGVALLALAAFALSYDALRQMAAASHIHQVLTYAFPLVIDGFIAIGIGALLVLHTAPLRPRMYVAGLVGIATATSIWANVLHAIRLNQQTHPGGLALDNVTVGLISAIAPLALAGAVHLYLLVQRRPDHAEPRNAGRHITAAATSEGGGASAPTEPPSDHNIAEQVEQVEQVEQAAGQVAQPAKPSAKHGDQQPMATWEQVVEIGRIAPLGRNGRVSRRHMETAIRDKGLRPGRRERLEKAKALLQAECDQSSAGVSV